MRKACFELCEVSLIRPYVIKVREGRSQLRGLVVVSKFRGRNFFKGVECNIPLSVSVYYPLIVPEEIIYGKWINSKYFMTCQHNTGKVSEAYITRLSQGYFGNCKSREYLNDFGTKYLHKLFPFSFQ
jgi:hypothetical protein